MILGCSRFFFGLVLLVPDGCGTLDGSSFSIGFSSISSSSPSLPANGANFGTSAKDGSTPLVCWREENHLKKQLPSNKPFMT